MVTHSSILAWNIPWMEEPGGLQSMGSQESDMTERLHYVYLCEKYYKPIIVQYYIANCVINSWVLG